MEQLCLPCDCAGACTILLIWDLDAEEHEFYMEFYTQVGTNTPFKYRLKQALNVLRNKEHSLNGMVLYEEKAHQLRDFLTVELEKHAAHKD